jgi:hypothetical protein
MHQGSQWLAQGVDFDLAAQAPDEELAVVAFMRVLMAHRRRATELGLAAFANLPAAPPKFVQVWDEIVKTTNPRVIRIADENDALPPAYIVEALVKNGGDFNLGR